MFFVLKLPCQFTINNKYIKGVRTLSVSSVTAITSIGRWLLPVLATLIIVACSTVLLRKNPKPNVLGFVINNANGDKMPLNNFETSIGRSTMCDIVLGYNTVSRFHAVIARRRGRWIIFDTNSKTGTFVNKDRVIERKYLENGDTIIFGNAVFKFYESLPDDEPEIEAYYQQEEMDYSSHDVSFSHRSSSYNLENCLTGEIMPIDDMNEIIIGNSYNCQIQINRPSVSKYHARVFKNDYGHWIIEDLDSTEGTLLNGVPLTIPVPLRDSDIIEVCGYTIRFNDTN